MAIPSQKKKPSSPKKPASPPTAAAAYAKVEKELAALEPDKLKAINLDIPQAVSVALGVCSSIKELLPAIQKALPEHPIQLIEKLDHYALAAWYAHILALAAKGPKPELSVLLEEATPLRANLLSDADALARRGLLDKETVEDIRSGHGHIDTANDLVALSALFTMRWSVIENKTAATMDEVKRAGELGPLVLVALGVREAGAPEPPLNPADQRARAFTLFINAYDEARRAVIYLRWHEGDADEIAPSLYKKGRSMRSSATRDDAEAEAQGPEAQDEPAKD